MKATTKTTATKRTTNKVNSKSTKTNKTTTKSTNRVEKGIWSWVNRNGKTTYYAKTTGKYLGSFTSLTKARAARKAVMSK